MSQCDLKSSKETDTNSIMEGLILGIRDVIIQNGAKPLFVISPSLSDFKYKNTLKFLKMFKKENKPPPDWGNKKSLIFFQSLLKRLNVECLDHYQSFLKMGNKDFSDFYFDNSHYSAKGNFLLAQAIDNYIHKSES